MLVTTQEEFDRSYISSSEIVSSLGIARSTLQRWREGGLLPGAINIGDGQVYVWPREYIRPFVEACKQKMNARRGDN